ncbi:hypothetical protein FGO68_gene4435 [Halteria grandinella]|uniref:Uncharacterized protein n=1 Tax=Halteria grandinella TaxID=5974 RepID=A0A8J8TAN9_HALGN|nr:hypothetical protein FGO68_gene4435 [Halteria grandinella]
MWCASRSRHTCRADRLKLQIMVSFLLYVAIIDSQIMRGHTHLSIPGLWLANLTNFEHFVNICLLQLCFQNLPTLQFAK